jgi:hypothetical protein
MNNIALPTRSQRWDLSTTSHDDGLGDSLCAAGTFGYILLQNGKQSTVRVRARIRSGGCRFEAPSLGTDGGNNETPLTMDGVLQRLEEGGALRGERRTLARPAIAHEGEAGEPCEHHDPGGGFRHRNNVPTLRPNENAPTAPGF